MLLWHEFKYSLRAFRTWKLLAATVVLTLAVGIGSTTAIFSVVDALLLNPLPYANADRLVLIWQRVPDANVQEDWLSAGQFNDIVEQSESFEELALILGGRMLLNRRAPGEDVGFLLARSSFFRVMNARPHLGRVLTAEDDRVGAERVTVLTYDLWQRRYGGDPDIVGETVGLGHIGIEVVGVLEPEFRLDETVLPVPGSIGSHDMMISLPLSEERLVDRTREYYNVIGRLKPGVSEEQAQAELDVIATRMREAGLPQIDDASFQLDVVPLLDQVVSSVRGALWILLAAAAILLVIACINVGNLLLMRATTRDREFGVCTAMGATRSRVVARLFIEGSLLALAGGVFGSAIAYGSIELLGYIGASQLPRFGGIQLDSRSLVFAVAISALTSLVFGHAPAHRASRVDLVSAMKGTVSSSATFPKRISPSTAFVIVQVALAFCLLVGSALLIQSFVHLLKVDPGFTATGRLTFRLEEPPVLERTDEDRTALAQELLRRTRALPGVRGAATGTPLPFGQGVAYKPMHVEGFERGPDDPAPVVDRRFVSPGYFRTMGIRLVAGRIFDPRDTAPGAPEVRIVDRLFAERFWPGQDPIGKSVGRGDDEVIEQSDKRALVVGVVEHVRHSTLETDGRMTLYVPSGVVELAYLIVHAEGDPSALMNPVMDAIRTAAPDIVVSDVRTMRGRLRDATAERRLILLVMQAFGVVAWLLAAVGLYGVIAYGVARGAPEIGTRMVLGADGRNVAQLVLSHGSVVISLGLAAGVSLSLLGVRLLDSLLFAISGVDPPTYVAVVVLLAATGILACWIPARRAARTDPVRVLRL